MRRRRCRGKKIRKEYFSAMPDNILKSYDVVITRTGHVAVMATDAKTAMTAAGFINTDSIQWDDDWQPTDAHKIET